MHVLIIKTIDAVDSLSDIIIDAISPVEFQ